ncbi:Histone deacetylase 11, partial [Ataeniobius toweri]|nr:Histone deacetylase 11 [Ataeniobius toweri]
MTRDKIALLGESQKADRISLWVQACGEMSAKGKDTAEFCSSRTSRDSSCDSSFLGALGNGHERDFLDDTRVFIMDMYNHNIYPGDLYAKRAIKRKVELDWGTEDFEYLQKVELHTGGALNEVHPDIIVYNAGTDILDGDPLGGLSISPQ